MLPEVLLSQGQVSREQIVHALQQQQETGKFFGDILAEDGILDEKTLVGFLAKHCKIPHLSLLDYLLDKALLEYLPADVCWKYHLLPVDKMGKNLTVAMVNPLNRQALLAIRELCPDLRIKPILCAHNDFERAAEKLFGATHEHDEGSWSDLPLTVAPSTKGETPSSPNIPKATPEPFVANTVAPLQREEESVSQTPTHDALLDSVFGQRPPESRGEDTSPDPEEEESEVFIDKSPTTLDEIANDFTGAMLDSMRDTYELLTRKIPFFSSLFSEDVAKLFTHGKVSEYDAGTVVFEKGDPGETMFILLNGSVEIRNGYRRLAILNKGDIFGEMALVSDAPRSASAITMARSSLLSLSFEDIRNNMPPQVSIQLLVNIILTLSERLRIANDALHGE